MNKQTLPEMFSLLLKVSEVLIEFHFASHLDHQCQMFSQVYLIHTTVSQDWWLIKYKVNYFTSEEKALFYQGHCWIINRIQDHFPI